MRQKAIGLVLALLFASALSANAQTVIYNSGDTNRLGTVAPGLGECLDVNGNAVPMWSSAGSWQCQGNLPISFTSDAPLTVYVAHWAGGALGAMANYGTSPGAVLVPGVNAFITNTAIGITPTDRTIVTGSVTGASQTMMAANASRHSLTVQNIGNANCGVNPTGGTAAIGGAGTLTLVPQGSYQPRIPTLSAVTIICTAGQPIYGEEN